MHLKGELPEELFPASLNQLTLEGKPSAFGPKILKTVLFDFKIMTLNGMWDHG